MNSLIVLLLTVAPLLSSSFFLLPPPTFKISTSTKHTYASIRSVTSQYSPFSSEPTPEVDPRRKDPSTHPPPAPVRMPMVDSSSGQMDVVSRLLKDRILLLGTDVNDECANVLVAQLLYLANQDPEKDITLYINSPGGSVSAGMAIYDAMQVRAMAGCLARTSALFVSDERERCVHTHRQKTSRQRESSVATHTALSTSHANGLRFPVSAHDACRTTGERRDGHKYRFQRHAQTAMPTSLTPRSHLAHTCACPHTQP